MEPVGAALRVFHLTHGKNLAGIIEAGELRCKADLDQQRARYQNIAYPRIQTRRASVAVTCGPAGVIHDYVPFYFCPRSPMLFAHHRRQIETHSEGQRPLIHLATTVEAIIAAGSRWVFSDGHAAMAYTEFFDDLADLHRVDWRVIASRNWADTDQDGDRKRRKQAEFLVQRALPWAAITEIGVLDVGVKRRVLEIVAGAAHRPAVTVYKAWYY